MRSRYSRIVLSGVFALLLMVTGGLAQAGSNPVPPNSHAYGEGYAEFSDEERAQLPPVPQTVVRVHPGSRRRTLYIASHASHIVGWPVEKGRALLKDLIDFSTQPRFVYQHRWCGGDLVAWDDRCTLHRARLYDDTRHRRDMRRTTVADSASTLQQARPNQAQPPHS